MNYDEFDIGNQEDEICIQITKLLQSNPKTANEITKEIYNNEYKIGNISPRLQKMKKLGIISNVRTQYNVCYWGLNKKYRK